MRKLAREAVLFMLVGAAISGFGTFMDLSFHDHRMREDDEKSFKMTGNYAAPGVYHDSDFAAVAHFYDFAYATPKVDRVIAAVGYRGYVANAVVALVFGGYGFIGGFVIWCLYRLMRFAMFG